MSASAAASARFIPAFAGNAIPGGERGQLDAVHPRVCGERHRSRPGRAAGCGSSPRLRGTLNRQRTCSVLVRFIPAFAGNALHRRACTAPPPVHPRVCGERRVITRQEQEAIGSSPRLRGTRLQRCTHTSLPRFIPAFAGNARPRPRRNRGGPVHPRVCGERPSTSPPMSAYIGSSPRLRGTRHELEHRQGAVRFIPAFAGNASTRSGLYQSSAVHPRVCGERAFTRVRKAWANGSSPRLRGTLRHAARLPRAGRFIPAFAGNAVSLSRQVAVFAVHPRVCGERTCWNLLLFRLFSGWQISTRKSVTFLHSG